MTETRLPSLQRRVFCNRTLNMRAIRAVGFDMDYTLIRYRTDLWEERAFEVGRKRLAEQGWPVESLRFQRELVVPGLVVDTELGNLVKLNRFGHVRRACHGTTMLDFRQAKELYTSQPVDLASARWEFLDTMFSLSESCLYVQLIDLLDAQRLPSGLDPRTLARVARSAIDAAHLEGAVKAEVMADPERYVVDDPEMVETLRDLADANKALLLITNSEWEYTHAMLSHAIDRHLPRGQTYRELFSVVVVQARKPSFFSGDAPAFRLVDSTGLFRPHRGPLEPKQVYAGGHARLLEAGLALSGDEVLYVGDHIYADVHASGNVLRWRTALIVPELEAELMALAEFEVVQQEIDQMMGTKTVWEHELSQLRLRVQRHRTGRNEEARADLEQLRHREERLRQQLIELDARIAPLVERSGSLVSARWGQLLRCGADKSFLARQIERYADLYTSRVSNLLYYTPFVYLRAPRVSLPHDADVGTDW